MYDLVTRFWHDLSSRPSGPFALRFVLQPTIAVILGIRAGLRDAREDKPAYLWSVFMHPTQRRELLRSGWKDIAKVFILAIILDVLFQLVALRWIYPTEALVIAFALAIVPYAFVRGPVCRIAKKHSLVLLVSSCALISSCAGPPVQSYQDDAHPRQGQSFQWVTQPVAKELKLEDPHIDFMTSLVEVKQLPEEEGMLRAAIEKALVKEGMVLNTDGDPDYYVTFFGKAKDQDWISSWSGFTPSIEDVPVILYPDFSRDLAHRSRDGDIYLVLYSRRSKSPAWTGVDTELRGTTKLTRSDVLASVERLVSELHEEIG